MADDWIVLHLYGHVSGEKGRQVDQVVVGQVSIWCPAVAGMEHALLNKQSGPARVGFLGGDSWTSICEHDRGFIKPVADTFRMIG